MNSAQMAAFTFLTLCCLLWPGVLLKSIQISDQTNSLVKGTANVKTEKHYPLLGHTSDFDYYVFTQQWPVSNCLTASSYDDCQIPANVSGWLIHGLWPSNFDGSYPAYCDDDYDFNDKEIEPIWGQLAKYWTNLYMDSAVDSFWEHEWDKHGTCAYTAHDMSSEFDYFNTTLGFHFDYPVGQWLLDAGISPDNSAIQNTSVINKVISDKVGKQTIFQCDYDQYKKEHIVNQIEICMDRNFKPIDCEESIENCNSDGKVLYPATVYHKNCDKTRENIKE